MLQVGSIDEGQILVSLHSVSSAYTAALPPSTSSRAMRATTGASSRGTSLLTPAQLPALSCASAPATRSLVGLLCPQERERQQPACVSSFIVQTLTPAVLFPRQHDAPRRNQVAGGQCHPRQQTHQHHVGHTLRQTSFHLSCYSFAVSFQLMIFARPHHPQTQTPARRIFALRFSPGHTTSWRRTASRAATTTPTRSPYLPTSY